MSDDPQRGLPGAALDAWAGGIDDDVTRATGDLEMLRSRVDDLTGEVRQLRGELRVLKDLLAQQASGRVTSSSAHHLAAAGEYGRIVEQDFLHIAQQAVGQRRTAGPGDVARAMAGLSRAVFDTDPPSASRALGLLRGRIPDTAQLREIIRRGLQVRARAEQTGDDVFWDFDVTVGALPASDQTVWGGCAPDQPVVFVVAPAYRVGATPYYLQTVYTASS
jgi:hypothetical protein